MYIHCEIIKNMFVLLLDYYFALISLQFELKSNYSKKLYLCNKTLVIVHRRVRAPLISKTTLHFLVTPPISENPMLFLINLATKCKSNLRNYLSNDLL